MNLHSIQFAIEVDTRLIDPDRGHVAAVRGHKFLDWHTGWGPCGRWVHKLTAEIDLATVRITQESYSKDVAEDIYRSQCRGLERVTVATQIKLGVELREDRKIETFVYKLEDVRGRIKAVQR